MGVGNILRGRVLRHPCHTISTTQELCHRSNSAVSLAISWILVRSTPKSNDYECIWCSGTIGSKGPQTPDATMIHTSQKPLSPQSTTRYSLIFPYRVLHWQQSIPWCIPLTMYFINWAPMLHTGTHACAHAHTCTRPHTSMHSCRDT